MKAKQNSSKRVETHCRQIWPAIQQLIVNQNIWLL